ncbi:MAG TPA: sporulation protein Cse60 [Acholeplasmataceae bacterium]|nr:sporulation protein Cse60 [Acholeplasmataceae bacterium]
MKVKLFDESHEKDLEMEVNNFLESIAGKKVIDIKYQVAIMYDMKEQIYCYSAMVIYED